MQTIRIGDQVALCDDEDYEGLLGYSWSPARRGAITYAQTNVTTEDGRRTIQLMHRLIMGNPASRIDHHDRNGLNNQRSNLRLATGTQNLANQAKRDGLSSAYKGVCWAKRYNRWVAYIKVRGQRAHLGTFTDEVEAAKAYDAAAVEHFGEFALLNFEGTMP